MATVSNTSIKTADGVGKSKGGFVHWVVVSAAATGGAWQLNDSDDDGGTDLVSAVAPANSITMLTFDPSVEFSDAIFADIPGSNITLTVGYDQSQKQLADKAWSFEARSFLQDGNMPVIQARTREQLRVDVGWNLGHPFVLIEADATGLVTTLITDDFPLGGSNEHRGKYLVFTSGTNDGSVRRITSSVVSDGE